MLHELFLRRFVSSSLFSSDHRLDFVGTLFSFWKIVWSNCNRITTEDLSADKRWRQRHRLIQTGKVSWWMMLRRASYPFIEPRSTIELSQKNWSNRKQSNFEWVRLSSMVQVWWKWNWNGIRSNNSWFPKPSEEWIIPLCDSLRWFIRIVAQSKRKSRRETVNCQCVYQGCYRLDEKERTEQIP